MKKSTMLGSLAMIVLMVSLNVSAQSANPTFLKTLSSEALEMQSDLDREINEMNNCWTCVAHQQRKILPLQERLIEKQRFLIGLKTGSDLTNEILEGRAGTAGHVIQQRAQITRLLETTRLASTERSLKAKLIEINAAVIQSQRDIIERSSN